MFICRLERCCKLYRGLFIHLSNLYWVITDMSPKSFLKVILKSLIADRKHYVSKESLERPRRTQHTHIHVTSGAKTVDQFVVVMNSFQLAALPWIPALWSLNPTVLIHFEFSRLLLCRVSCWTRDHPPQAGKALHDPCLTLHVCYIFQSVFEHTKKAQTHTFTCEISSFFPVGYSH